MGGRFLRWVALFVLIAFVSGACAPLPPPGTALTPEERESAKRNCIARYTALGALGGAALGLLLGSKNAKAEGALIGAAAGGALAFIIAWGKCLATYSDLNSYPVADALSTAQRVGYSPSQGVAVRVEHFALSPPEGVSPGGELRADGSYYVMIPEAMTEVKVKEVRILHYYDESAREWKELGSVENEIVAAPGTRRAEGRFDIPQDAAEGNYRITLSVECQGVSDSAMREVMIKKGLPMGPGSNKPQTQKPPGQSHQPSPQHAVVSETNQGSKGLSQPRPDQTTFKMVEVTAQTLKVRAAPDPKAKVVATVKKGDRFPIMEKSGDATPYVRIRMEDGTEGWVAEKSVK